MQATRAQGAPWAGGAGPVPRPTPLEPDDASAHPSPGTRPSATQPIEHDLELGLHALAAPWPGPPDAAWPGGDDRADASTADIARAAAAAGARELATQVLGALAGDACAGALASLPGAVAAPLALVPIALASARAGRLVAAARYPDPATRPAWAAPVATAVPLALAGGVVAGLHLSGVAPAVLAGALGGKLASRVVREGLGQACNKALPGLRLEHADGAEVEAGERWRVDLMRSGAAMLPTLGLALAHEFGTPVLADALHATGLGERTVQAVGSGMVEGLRSATSTALTAWAARLDGKRVRPHPGAPGRRAARICANLAHGRTRHETRDAAAIREHFGLLQDTVELWGDAQPRPVARGVLRATACELKALSELRCLFLAPGRQALAREGEEGARPGGAAAAAEAAIDIEHSASDPGFNDGSAFLTRSLEPPGDEPAALPEEPPVVRMHPCPPRADRE